MLVEFGPPGHKWSISNILLVSPLAAQGVLLHFNKISESHSYKDGLWQVWLKWERRQRKSSCTIRLWRLDIYIVCGQNIHVKMQMVD